MDNTSGVVKHKHHIIPRHAGGSDDPSNLVELSVEDHAEAHRLLWEKHNRWQDRIAWQMLSGQISNAEGIKQVQSEYMKNRVISEKTKSRMSDGQKKRHSKGQHPMLGKKFTEESRKRMSNSHKGQIPSNKGYVKTAEEIERDRIAQYKVPIYECDVCGKPCRGKGNLKQHMAKHKEV